MGSRPQDPSAGLLYGLLLHQRGDRDLRGQRQGDSATFGFWVGGRAVIAGPESWPRRLRQQGKVGPLPLRECYRWSSEPVPQDSLARRPESWAGWQDGGRQRCDCPLSPENTFSGDVFLPPCRCFWLANAFIYAKGLKARRKKGSVS